MFVVILSSSCSRRLGYGVLLWSAEEPQVPSGTVLPVYIRSNINNLWVAGIPREFRPPGSRVNKFEIPLPQLEMSGSKRRARNRAASFAPYALMYAETLQDGLPIRESPENTSRRVYRLRQGEIIKILAPVRGTVAVGASGDPLPGEWFRVLTEDGTMGFCFSYRLNLFTHEGGSLAAAMDLRQDPEDPILERLLERTWSPEHYATMINSRRIDIDDLSQRWNFDPGLETGIAHIFSRDVDRTFSYNSIRSTGTLSWRFEGTSLQMSLRSENTLAVQFTEANGLLRTLLFVALPTRVDDIILQENARRERLFRNIYLEGPAFVSANNGTLSFLENGRFTWPDNRLIVPIVVPASALGSGIINMRLYLAPSMAERYTGAFTLQFDTISGTPANVDFLYVIDQNGFRIEHIPQTSLDGLTVVRRASIPQAIQFFRNERLSERPFDGAFDDPFDDFFDLSFPEDDFDWDDDIQGYLQDLMPSFEF
ncbi:MAG: SH3 domain-containing protein [Treponema sp.]|nr:SH3 domain-containing protein [Treponema sp.]